MIRIEKRPDEDLLKSFFNYGTELVRSELTRRGYGLNWNTFSLLEVFDTESSDLVYVVTAEGVERV